MFRISALACVIATALSAAPTASAQVTLDIEFDETFTLSPPIAAVVGLPAGDYDRYLAVLYSDIGAVTSLALPFVGEFAVPTIANKQFTDNTDLLFVTDSFVPDAFYVVPEGEQPLAVGIVDEGAVLSAAFTLQGDRSILPDGGRSTVAVLTVPSGSPAPMLTTTSITTFVSGGYLKDYHEKPQAVVDPGGPGTEDRFQVDIVSDDYADVPTAIEPSLVAATDNMDMTFTDVGGAYGLGRLTGSAYVEVGFLGGVVPGGQHQMVHMAFQTNFLNDISEGGFARGEFADGSMVMLLNQGADQSQTVISGDILSLTLVQAEDAAGTEYLHGTGTLGNVQGIVGDSDEFEFTLYLQPVGEMPSDFSRGFAATGALRVPEPGALALLALGALTLGRRRR